jgi:hypothetical protein
MTATSADLRHAVALLLDDLSPSEQAAVERFLVGVAELSELPPSRPADGTPPSAPSAPSPRPWALWG